MGFTLGHWEPLSQKKKSPGPHTSDEVRSGTPLSLMVRCGTVVGSEARMWLIYSDQAIEVTAKP
ncbi:hypothetical protein ABI_16120 [Asticcacaulis biprosthecium C19]|uniref:Uncharacterized protein n=1 Tax=Asticcacaulis biprosthecium C19 TaxID=715226 RepID=F4QJR5_9CAUL|nr:hypothetical protein ABI_16120 [Asticcacaulis biprosthecium C19]